MKRTTVRLGALASAAALTLLSAAPAQAATLATASANALSVSLAGNGADSGTVTATYDGTAEHRTGNTTPPIDLLENQALLNLGAAAQNATAGVRENGAGWSAGCAGVVGEGGSVAQVGDSDCITPGEPVDVSIAHLDLTGVKLTDPESALAPLGEAAQPAVDQLVGPLTKAVSDGLAPLGEIGLAGTLGAVQARCAATPDDARGWANIIDSRLALTLAGEQVDAVDLPAEPAPNTDVLVDLDQVLDTVLGAVRTDLENTLDGQLDAVGEQVLAPVKEQIVDNVVGQIAPQLAPLRDNVLRVTLNEQSSSGKSVEVTALHAEVLPAAQQMGGASLVDARIANVTCGPNATMAPVSTDGPATPATGPEDLPAVPTAISAGVPGTGTGDGGGYGPAALASLAVLAGTAGLVGLRRSLTE